MRKLILTLATIPVFAGCGGDGSDDVFKKAARRVEHRSLRSTFQMSGAIAQHQFSYRGSGSFSADGDQGVLRGTFGQDKDELRGRVIFVGAETWATSKKLDGHWVHATDTSFAQTVAGPPELARHLRLARDVKKLGTESVDGQSTTHYRGQIDVRELIDATPGVDAARAKDQLNGAHPKLPIDAWIDGHGEARRVQFDIADSSGQGVSYDVTVREYDVPVAAKPPPKDRVIEASVG